MTHRKLATVRRLERLLPSYLENQRRGLARGQMDARKAMIRLGALVLYGDPKLDEPLALAWERTLARVGEKPTDNEFAAELAEEKLFDLFMVHMPGENERENFECVLSKAPVWLLRFTHARVTASLLAIACPELTDSPPWGHDGFRDARNWPMLPKGTLQAGEPMNQSGVHDPEDDRFLLELLKKNEFEWTRHEHRRFNQILDAEFLAAPQENFPGG